MHSPTDASPPSLRTATHGLGPIWIATPSSYRTCTDCSLPVSRRTAKSSGHYLGPWRHADLTISISQIGAEALVFFSAPIMILYAGRVAELALESRLPSISNASELLKAGGLMSYGPNINDLCRRAATYVDKILKGANPADLPLEQPIKFELVINLKTARAL